MIEKLTDEELLNIVVKYSLDTPDYDDAEVCGMSDYFAEVGALEESQREVLITEILRFNMMAHRAMKEPVKIETSFTYDTDLNVFIIRYFSGDNVYFEGRMLPEDFEAMTAQMIRLVKEVNIMQIQKYEQRKALEEIK